MKAVVINQYGIELSAGRKNGEYVYIPNGGTLEEDYRRCERWIKRNDPAGTCRIIEVEECHA